MKGESPEDCVVRRVKEELSVDISIIDKMDAYNVETSQNKTFRIYPFFAEVGDG